MPRRSVFFGVVSAHPPVVGVSIGGKGGRDKDTLANARANGEFVANLTTEDMSRGMIISAMNFPADESEIEPSGFTVRPGEVVKPPLIDQSPAQLECRVRDILEFGRDKEKRFFCDRGRGHVPRERRPGAGRPASGPFEIRRYGAFGRRLVLGRRRAAGAETHAVQRLAAGQELRPLRFSI